MLTDSEMRQAAIANPGRCIYKSWNPNRQYPKWKPMNFHPDNWRKVMGDVRQSKTTLIKSGFDQVEKVVPPSDKTGIDLTRPDSWNYDRYGYPISESRPRPRRY